MTLVACQCTCLDYLSAYITKWNLLLVMCMYVCGRGAFLRSTSFSIIVEQDTVTRDLDGLSRRLTRWGASATSLSLPLSSDMNILDTSSS